VVNLAGRASGFRFSPLPILPLLSDCPEARFRCEVLRSGGEPYGFARLRIYCIWVLMPVPEIERSFQRLLRALVRIGRKARRSGTACEPERGERLSHIGVEPCPWLPSNPPECSAQSCKHRPARHNETRAHSRPACFPEQ